jgi:hypothetical protein
VVERIISGGQNGADLAGLIAAKRLGIPTGGYAPKGWRVCNPDGTNGSNPSLADFGLRQTKEAGYLIRTTLNVLEGDGTVWFGTTKSSGGKLTIGECMKNGKPCIINPSPAELKKWVEEKKIRVLNVAGNRASEKYPGVYEQTYNTIVEAFTLSKVEKKS